MNTIINLSVHQLVDFLLRKGDIDDRVFNSTTMEEGSEIHRAFQKKQDDHYLSEFDLKTTIVYGNYEINLHGRADGVILGNPVVIDEIKSTNSKIEDFNEKNEEWHLGQAECYAYMYCKLEKLESIRVRLTYISQIDNKSLSKYFDYSFGLLENKINEYIRDYFDFYQIVERKKFERNSSIKKLVFPFDLRKGQSEIIKFSEDAIQNRDIGFLEASTGLGKTIGITFGALKGSLKAKTDKIFYLTAKNSGFKSASDCLEILRDNGLKLSSCEILAKEKMCLNKNHNCNPDDCPFAKDYYDKLNVILADILDTYDDLNSNEILRIASENRMCPFELQLDLSLYVDFVILDYNYVFHPISYLRRFFDLPDSAFSCFLLVDEAHNLVDRSRDMYSASLSFSNFKKAKKSYKDIKSKAVTNIIKKLTTDFNLFNKFEFDGDYIPLQKLDDDFIKNLTHYQDVIRKYQKDHPKYKNMDDKEFGIDVYKFLTIYELFNDNYRIFINKTDDGFTINLKCLDASTFLVNIMDKTSGGVFFSGTLTPIEYYKKAILGSEDYKSLELPSPFEENNLRVLVNNSISIRYKNRANTLSKVIDYIDAFVNFKVGNYIVYVPSFAYLNMIKNNYRNTNINVIYQDGNMTLLEKENFLNSFKEEPKKTTVGICVLGGSFSEGIDLVSDRLIGVVVVGVGLPSISFENDLIKDYYNNLELDGFTYAYVNPGINKIMQAVGRLIRSESDRGIALLIDDRFYNKNYLSLYENKWKNSKKINSIESLKNELNSFFN